MRRTEVMVKFLRCHERKIRFLAVGAVNSFLGIIFIFTLQYLLIETLPPQAVLILAFFANSPFGYCSMKLLVFKTKGNHLREYFKYLASLLVVCVLGILFLSLLVDILHMNVYVAQGLNLVVSSIMAYLLQSFFTFARFRAGTQKKDG